MLDADTGPVRSHLPLDAVLRRRTVDLLLPATLLLLALPLGGCREQKDLADLEVARNNDSKQPDEDHFEAAIDFLKMRDEHSQDRSAGQVSYHLSRWIRDRAADPDWSIDRPLINTLPDTVRRAPAAKESLSDASLARLDFRLSDVLILEESRWLHAIAKTASSAEPPPALAQWLATSGLSRKSTRNLAAAAALFDWTIRNIQLDPLLPYPKTSAAGPVTDAQQDDRALWSPPMQGTPGPGYTGLPWHVLMYGHGDSLQRARVFILLLRQLRIDAGMLAIDNRTGRAEPWLPAVLIDQQLYLFDTELGIPLPDVSGKGIATLSQVVADPALLTSLNIGKNYTYRVNPADLNQVVVLLDASPEALSQRMLLVEEFLNAKDQMVLTIDPHELKQPLRACQGVTDVRLWEVPIEASVYQQAYTMQLERDPEFRSKEFLQHGIFETLSPVVKGRRRYLLGQLQKQGDEAGATSYFLNGRMTDSTLEVMEDSKSVQKSMGLERPLGMNEEEWAYRIAQIKRMQVESKQLASYWLGLTHLEQRNYDVAASWLKDRYLDHYPDGSWTNGARYNLARCYEALGKFDDARQLYMIDESPQRYGNLLRARALEGHSSESTTSDSPAPDSPAPNSAAPDAAHPPAAAPSTPETGEPSSTGTSAAEGAAESAAEDQTP